jgi:hypothetical protein
MRPKWSGIRGGQPNPIVCGRKFCATCGRWRPLSDFRVHRDVRLRLSYCDACLRRMARERREAMTPQQIENRREYDRFYNYGRRRARGQPVREWRTPRSSAVDRVERILLPREPLLATMEQYIRAQRSNGDPDFSWEQFARVVKCSQRAIYRIRTGESQRVRIDVADRIAYGMGVPLSLIYEAGELG